MPTRTGPAALLFALLLLAGCLAAPAPEARPSAGPGPQGLDVGDGFRLEAPPGAAWAAILVNVSPAAWTPANGGAEIYVAQRVTCVSVEGWSFTQTYLVNGSRLLWEGTAVNLASGNTGTGSVHLAQAPAGPVRLLLVAGTDDPDARLVDEAGLVKAISTPLGPQTAALPAWQTGVGATISSFQLTQGATGGSERAHGVDVATDQPLADVADSPIKGPGDLRVEARRAGDAPALWTATASVASGVSQGTWRLDLTLDGATTSRDGSFDGLARPVVTATNARGEVRRDADAALSIHLARDPVGSVRLAMVGVPLRLDAAGLAEDLLVRTSGG
jgi:hypothetical protein